MNQERNELHHFKDLILENIEDKLKDFVGENNSFKDNTQKGGHLFAEWYVDLFIEHDGGYEKYTDELPESNDKGVDFVLIDEKNKRVIIGQSKATGLSTKNVKAQKRDEIIAFFALHEHIMKDNWLEQASDEAREQLQEYKQWVRKKFTIKYVFVTASKKPDDINLSSPDPGLAGGAILEREIIDIYDLKAYHREAESMSDEPPEEVEFNLAVNSSFESKKPKSIEKVGRTLIATISGNELNSLFQRHRTSLFAYNIRQYLGKPKNKKIIDTAQNNPEQFFYFNNGITAICSEYKLKNEKAKNNPDKIINTRINAKNFQIINGAQTVGSIREAAKIGANLSDLKVLLRVVETGELKTTQKGFNRDIVQYNNTQQKIDTWDFISNDTIQQYLEEVIRNDNKANGERYIYQRKRISKRKSGYKPPVKPEHFAKLIYSFTFKDDFDPGVPYGQGKALLIQKEEDSPDGLYDDVFKTENNKWTNKEIDEAKVAIQLWFLLDNYFRSLQKDVDKFKEVQGIKFIHIALLRDIIDYKDLSLSSLRKDYKKLKEFFDEYHVPVISTTYQSMVQYKKLKGLINVVRNYSRSKDQYEIVKDTIKDLYG